MIEKGGTGLKKKDRKEENGEKIKKIEILIN